MPRLAAATPDRASPPPLASTPRIRIVPADGVAALAEHLRAIAQSVFTAPPWSEDPGRARTTTERLLSDAAQPGFMLAVAEHGPHITGFAYGCPGRGLAWYASHPDATGTTEPFELRELAVLSHARGHGTGAALHDAVMTTAEGRPCWLTTDAHALPAVALYRSRGWQTMHLLPAIRRHSPGLLMRKPARPPPVPGSAR